MKYDVLILGGGPAGLVTALSLLQLRPNLKLRIVEKTNYEGFRHGETVPGAIGQFMNQLNLWQSFLHQQHLPAHGRQIHWAGQTEQETIFGMHGTDWHLDRPRFDQWLVQMATRAGTQVSTGLTVQQVNTAAGSVSLTNAKGNKINLLARFLINATGNSSFMKHEGITQAKADQLVAAYFEGRAVGNRTFTAIATSPEGWWYYCNVNTGKSVFAFFTDPAVVKNNQLTTAANFHELLPAHGDIARYFGHVPASALPKWVQVTPQINTCTGANWLAVGDAATTFDPLAGMGIFKAFQTGILASYATINFLEGNTLGLEKYKANIQAMYQAHMNTRQQFYNAVAGYPQSAFWPQRQTTQQAPVLT